MKRKVGAYIHIPFCVRKCEYCDFLSFSANEEVREAYVQQLIREITASPWITEDLSISTVFFGGGTPSILSGEQIGTIMEALRSGFDIDEDAEITIEVNPGTVSREKLMKFKEAGINRLSIGLQSAQNKELELLGRIHTYEEFLECFAMARAEGFHNINVDLMGALPSQSFESYKDTLEKITRLQPEHISAYSLIIEEGTPFAKKYMEDEILREKGEQPQFLPSEEEERRMYDFGAAFLEESGYHRYEISNYARDGYQCQHNVGYWVRREYLGFGLGAASLVHNIRYKNQEDLLEYLHGNQEQQAELLEEAAQMEEFMFLGLRLEQGVSCGEFFDAFQVSMKQVFGKQIEELKKQGLLKEEGGRIILTAYGRDVSNYVLAKFLIN